MCGSISPGVTCLPSASMTVALRGELNFGQPQQLHHHASKCRHFPELPAHPSSILWHFEPGWLMAAQEWIPGRIPCWDGYLPVKLCVPETKLPQVLQYLPLMTDRHSRRHAGHPVKPP